MLSCLFNYESAAPSSPFLLLVLQFRTGCADHGRRMAGHGPLDSHQIALRAENVCLSPAALGLGDMAVLALELVNRQMPGLLVAPPATPEGAHYKEATLSDVWVALNDKVYTLITDLSSCYLRRLLQPFVQGTGNEYSVSFSPQA